MASRVFQIFARAGRLGRIYEETRRSFIGALQTALDENIFVAEREPSDDPATWSPLNRSCAHVRRAAAPCTKFRTRN